MCFNLVIRYSYFIIITNIPVLFIYIAYRVLMFSHLSGPKIIMLFFSPPFFVDPFQIVGFLLSDSSCKLLHLRISRSTLCIPGGYHSKIFLGSLSSSILCTWPYQLELIYLYFPKGCAK